ncbi:MAG: Asp23/Gls24 family envelope stress response protein [Terracoccus sp.]
MAANDATGANATLPRPKLTGRGHLVISQHVMEQLASQVASEITQAGGTSGGLLGLGARTDLSARPAAKVELSGQQASISLDIVLGYPSPLAATTDRVRRHVVTKVQELTGVEVTRVDIDVTGFHLTTGQREAMQ